MPPKQDIHPGVGPLKFRTRPLTSKCPAISIETGFIGNSAFISCWVRSIIVYLEVSKLFAIPARFPSTRLLPANDRAAGFGTMTTGLSNLAQYDW